MKWWATWTFENINWIWESLRKPGLCFQLCLLGETEFLLSRKDVWFVFMDDAEEQFFLIHPGRCVNANSRFSAVFSAHYGNTEEDANSTDLVRWTFATSASFLQTCFHKTFCALAPIPKKYWNLLKGAIRTLLQITQSCFEFCCFHILSDADSFWMHINRFYGNELADVIHTRVPTRDLSEYSRQTVVLMWLSRKFLSRLHIRCSWSHWLQCWINRFSILLFELMVHLHSLISCNNNYKNCRLPILLFFIGLWRYLLLESSPCERQRCQNKLTVLRLAIICSC